MLTAMASQSPVNLPLDIDDEQAAVLYSPFRSKSVNPSSWNSKMKFWQSFLEQTTMEKHLITINTDNLPQLFLRKGLAPKCLPTVMEELQRLGKVKSLDDYKRLNSWVSWGFTTLVKAPLSWGASQIFGSPKKVSPIFVWPEVLKTVSEEFLLRLQSDIHQGILCPVFSYSKLEALSSKIISTREHFELVVHYLQSVKKIHLEERGHHGLLVKVCEREKTCVSPMKDTDAQCFEIDEARLKVENELNVLSNRIENLTSEAREFVKLNQKKRALHCLRKKKHLENSLASKTSTLHNLEGILMKIEDAKTNQVIVQACEAGLDVLKKMKHEVNVDKVESVMGEVQEAMEDAEEITDAVQSVGSSSDEELNALEEELAMLLSEDQKNQEGPEVIPSEDLLLPEFTNLSLSDSDFPQVPSHSPSSSKASSTKQEESCNKEAASFFPS